MLTPPTLAELAVFSGRPVQTFSAFASEALAQATLMLKIVTKLTDYPDDPDLRQLALNAIMEMADRLLLEQPFAEIISRPFQSETLGSYTYSRSTATASKVQAGLSTGLFWWELAIDELTVAGASLLAHGSIRVDIDGLTADPDGTVRLQNPAAGLDAPPYVRIS